MAYQLSEPLNRLQPAIAPQPDCQAVWAASLDRVADLELAMGHTAIAERLARLAAEKRENAR